jgi:hypothetical protein
MSVHPITDIRSLTRDWEAAEHTYSEEGADWYDYDTGYAVAVLALVPWIALMAILFVKAVA